ncbi:murein biosynthesis integral membrane protein MurJ [bacterium]|nr:murein biosynthesis integral membrane protein MurJ [bacterium]
MSERGNVIRAATTVSALTMISRVTGFVRDAVIAAYFGAGLQNDAFVAAFRIPNLLRRLFGEGALTASFIPIFTEVREHQGEERAKELFSIAFSVVVVILAATTALGIAFAKPIVDLLAPGFVESPEKDALTLLLLRVMFPYAILICLVALFMGVLNAGGRFFAPAFAPVLLNLSMIASALFFVNRLELPVMALAIGVLAGGVLQLALQLPYLKRLGYWPRWRFVPSDPDLRRIVILLLPSLIGISVYSINVFLNTRFASLLGSGTVSYIFYGDRLMELPQGIFAIALGTAILPAMSRHAARGERAELLGTLNFALRSVTALIIPIAAGMFVLSEPIINVLFQRGRFDYEATVKTAEVLRMYTFGLAFFSALRVIVPTFYALKDTLTPALVALATMFVNIFCAISFMGPTVSDADPFLYQYTRAFNPTGPMAHAGLALANSVSALFNFSIVVVILRKRLGRIGARQLIKTLAASAAASAVMALAVAKIATWYDFTTSGANAGKIAGLVLAIGAGVVVYFAVLFPFDREILSVIIRAVRRRRLVKLPEGETP